MAEKKKMGRPTVDPKSNNLRIRMSDDDVQILEECCKQTGLSKADVVRLGIREIHKRLHS